MDRGEEMDGEEGVETKVIWLPPPPALARRGRDERGERQR
jgi:hypothetical protein